MTTLHLHAIKRTLILSVLSVALLQAKAEQWIRINQLGYLPQSVKVAVLMSEEAADIREFRIVDAFSGREAYRSRKVRATGPLGQMRSTFRLDFSGFKGEGSFIIVAGNGRSPRFAISNRVYDGTADFVLEYMRQQRCGYNPFLRDSCHQKDAYIVYHPTRTGEHIDVRGGWHDATDCLQYTTTTANAIYQMMLAYEANPSAFADNYQANGHKGANGVPDIVDEIAWGMDWLSRMNPAPGEMYNQLADDRDHVGMRLPPDDRADYGWGPGNGRPVYFCSGQPQQQGKGMNHTTGIASTAGKFASDFAMGARLLRPFYPNLAREIEGKARAAYEAGVRQPGYCQTASVRSPYIYAECNWVDDMELGAYELFRLTGDRQYLDQAAGYGRQEPVTPWMGADTALHYQWYPFMNIGHYRLAAQQGARCVNREFTDYLRRGIDAVWRKAQGDPFLYGIPSIWCSNNLTTAMLTQCILYRQLTGRHDYEEMEAALRDWLLGCNPWGTSMIIELPRYGTYPTMPHSLWVRNHMGNSTGGLVDGPVYASIFGRLLGVSLVGAKAYEKFQPGRMVYHDGEHDYSTNEPTMDGTACLTFPFSTYQEEGRRAGGRVADRNVYQQGGIVRGDISRKRIALVFTAAAWADGAATIIPALKEAKAPGSFFFTGEFFEKYPDIVRRLVGDGHYVGSHSYDHLLYFPWGRRDTMLVSRDSFRNDIDRSYRQLAEYGITPGRAPYFIPPYEHYNDTISLWAREIGLQVVNYTAGTRSNADYTTPDMASYATSEELYSRLMDYESRNGLNGHLLMMHFGTHPARTDKFYRLLPRIITTLRSRGYEFVDIRTMVEK